MNILKPQKVLFDKLRIVENFETELKSDIELENISVENCFLENPRVYEVSIEKAVLKNVSIVGGNLEKSSVTDVEFVNCNFSNTSFETL